MSALLVSIFFASAAVCMAEKAVDVRTPAASNEAVAITSTAYQGFNPGYNSVVPPSSSYGTPLAPPLGPNGPAVGPLPSGTFGPAGPGVTGPSSFYRSAGFNEYSRPLAQGLIRNINGPNYVNGWRGTNYQQQQYQNGYVNPAYTNAGYVTPAVSPYTTGYTGQVPYNNQQYYNNYNPLSNVRYNNGLTGFPNARYVNNPGYISNPGYVNNGYSSVAPSGPNGIYNSVNGNGNGYNY